jgi:hypothetical protein
MSQTSEPLVFPSHFPPTDRWKKFFIGVRWLGPDLSFFDKLKAQQGQRTVREMSLWGGGQRQAVAETIGLVLHQRLRWPTEVFVPDDSFQVICTGPRFDFIDDFAGEEAIEKVELMLAIKVASAFWEGKEEATFGEVVDALLALKRQT